MEFEWDEEKREATLRKHGIDFRAAERVFETAHVLLRARRDTELRIMAVGRLDGVTISVIFTIRAGVIRIISARRARRDEREYFWAFHVGRNPKDDRPH